LFTVGLVAFGITKIETITKALVPIILISIGGLIVLAAVLSKPATKYIERGGKVPYLPSNKIANKFTDRRLAIWEKEIGVKSALSIDNFERKGIYVLSVWESPRSGSLIAYDGESDAIRMAEKIFKEKGLAVTVQSSDSRQVIYRVGELKHLPNLPATIGETREFAWEKNPDKWGKTKKGWRLEEYPAEYYQLNDLQDMKRLLFMVNGRNDRPAAIKALSRKDLLEKLLQEPEGDYPKFYAHWAEKLLKKGLHLPSTIESKKALAVR